MRNQPPVNSVKVFISYSHKDLRLARQLAADLTSCGVEVWLDEHQIKVGDSILMRISQALQDAHYVILLMSKTSIESPWVQREWLPILMSEIEAREIILLPVRLDDCRMPVIIRDKHYADMRESYWRGLSEIVDVFAARLAALASNRIGIKATQTSFKTIGFLDSIIEAVDTDESMEIAPLLNTIILASFGSKRVVKPPEWLLGEWLSTKGWNEGQIFKCANSHLIRPEEFHMDAIGSFSSLGDELVDSIMELDARTLLFSWYQRISALMVGNLADSGWGIWKTDVSHTHLKGIWWYGPAEHKASEWYNSEWAAYRMAPSLQAYAWELRKVSKKDD